MNSALPFGWIVQFDPSTGRNFYVDTATGVSHWEIPKLTDELPAYQESVAESITESAAVNPSNYGRNYAGNTASNQANPSVVDCPICFRKVQFNTINEHIEANCQEKTSNLKEQRITQQGYQQGYGQGQPAYGQPSYPQNYGLGYNQGQAGYNQGYQQQQPSSSSSRPQNSQKPKKKKNNGAGLGLALGGGLLGGLLLGDFLDGGFGDGFL